MTQGRRGYIHTRIRWEFVYQSDSPAPWFWRLVSDDTHEIEKIAERTFVTFLECLHDANLHGFEESIAPFTFERAAQV
jgi:hypothetical protein